MLWKFQCDNSELSSPKELVQYKKVVCSCSMVEITIVESLYNEVSWVSHLCQGFYGILVYVMSAVVLRNTSIISIRKLCRVVLLKEQIVYVYIVDIRSNVFEV